MLRWEQGTRMGRAKGDLIEGLAMLPWPAGIVFGAGGFFAVRVLLPMIVKGNPFAPVVAAFYVPASWLLLIVGLIGWRHFEQLVGEAFRRQGYAVEETGLGGPDGGIDLILRKDSCRVLVQCKQWRQRQVGVKVVREIYGLPAHHRADEVKIVCSGTYTRDAGEFAKDKPIELISGEGLLRMICEVQIAPVQTTYIIKVVKPTPAAPAPIASLVCPKCGKPMVERNNRTTGQKFWGCSTFPVCRGMRLGVSAME